MKNQKTNSMTTFQDGKQSKEKSTKATKQSSQLMKLFEDGLVDFYWAEKAVTKAMDKNTTTNKCDAMEGLIKEAEELLETFEAGAMCDAGIVSAELPTIVSGIVKNPEKCQLNFSVINLALISVKPDFFHNYIGRTNQWTKRNC